MIMFRHEQKVFYGYNYFLHRQNRIFQLKLIIVDHCVRNLVNWRTQCMICYRGRILHVQKVSRTLWKPSTSHIKRKLKFHCKFKNFIAVSQREKEKKVLILCMISCKFDIFYGWDEECEVFNGEQKASWKWIVQSQYLLWC